MKHYYQVTFSWKTLKGRKVSYSVSPFIFSNYADADDFGADLLRYNIEQALRFENKDKEFICAYDVHIVFPDDYNN